MAHGAVRVAAVLGIAVLEIVFAARGLAQVTVELDPPRPSLLYSADQTQDCSDLHALEGDQLPYHVVRLRAVAPPDATRFQWSLPKPNVGFLLADQDLQGSETSAAVRGFCCEFGNACILTAKALAVYDQPTILYAAPTCDVLPSDTRRQFGGGSVRVKVTAKAGKRRVGRATATIEYGRPAVAGVTLHAEGQDGLGKPSTEGFVFTDFNAIEAPADLPGMPAIETFDFAFGDDRESADTCPDDPQQPCVTLTTELGGKYLATVKTRLADGSALCDNMNVHVGTCPRSGTLRVIRDPARVQYASGDTVGVRVTFTNTSPRRPVCDLVLQGADVLTCEATFRLGDTEETKRTTWALQHCSATASQPCTTDADCSPEACAACEAGEVCLTQSHCSETLSQLCTADSDCAPREDACPLCAADERCVRVLSVPRIGIPAGDTVEIVNESILVENALAQPVPVSETWTIHAIPSTTDETSFRYRINGPR
jgi:hypothetical protein